MKLIKKLFSICVTAAIPFLIILTAIRLALLPVYVTFEYQTRSFPPDPYGFTTADRLHWSEYAIDYLIGKISHEQLGNQALDDGSPLFNIRELQHMLDVRILTGSSLAIWRGLIIFFILALLFFLISNDFEQFVRSIRLGVLVTGLIITTVLIFVSINFNLIFTKFHEIFFEGDTWLFYTTDNLIRLFPLRFWRDIFIFIGMSSVLNGTILYCLPLLLYNQFNKKAGD